MNKKPIDNRKLQGTWISGEKAEQVSATLKGIADWLGILTVGLLCIAWGMILFGPNPPTHVTITLEGKQ